MSNAPIKNVVIKSKRGAVLVWLISILSIFSTCLIGLDRTPPLWRDEGWTLTVARNWVESGHYGMLQVGEPAPPGLAAAFPSVASIALAFRWLGIGIWQGRLVSVVFLAGAMVMLYFLASRLYNRPIARGTLAVVVLMSTHLEMNPIFMGRQALAEPLMLFFALAGYAVFLLALLRSLWLFPLALVLWGIAINSKAQFLPFWLVSLLIPLLLMLLRRQWKLSVLLGMGLIGSYATYQGLVGWQRIILEGHTLPSPTLDGLYQVTAFVPLSSVRLTSLKVVLVIGLPTLLGILYAVGKEVRLLAGTQAPDNLQVVRITLLAFVGSWLAWYVLLSVGWIRYLFPATFVGSIYAAAMLDDLTVHFDIRETLDRIARSLMHLRLDGAGFKALLSVLLIAVFVPVTLGQLFRMVSGDMPAVRVANWLNTHTSDNAIVETYDNEIFFLLDRRYHYPPDQVSIDITRRTELGQQITIAYDPLVANPDYLVIGSFSREAHLYDRVVTRDDLQLLVQVGPYDIYRRMH